MKSGSYRLRNAILAHGDTSESMSLPCFKAYDIRGRIPDELNTDLAYKVGRAYARFLRGKRVLLSLEPGQMALLVGDNRLQAIYLDGGHQLEIGNAANQMGLFRRTR